MRTIRAVAVAAALGMAACGSESTSPETDASANVQSVQPGDEVRLRLNQTATVRGTEARVTFRGVPADSRCPIDAVCVWMGDAQVVLEMAGMREVLRRETLHTNGEPKAVEFENYRVELVDVAPARSSDRDIPQREYSVRLRISGR